MGKPNTCQSSTLKRVGRAIKQHRTLMVAGNFVSFALVLSAMGGPFVA